MQRVLAAIVHEKVCDALTAKVVEGARKLTIGDTTQRRESLHGCGHSTRTPTAESTSTSRSAEGKAR